jgi:hypothetical protein
MTEPSARPRPAPRRSARIGGIAALIAATSYSSFLVSPYLSRRGRGHLQPADDGVPI